MRLSEFRNKMALSKCNPHTNNNNFLYFKMSRLFTRGVDRDYDTDISFRFIEIVFFMHACLFRILRLEDASDLPRLPRFSLYTRLIYFCRLLAHILSTCPNHLSYRIKIGARVHELNHQSSMHLSIPLSILVTTFSLTSQYSTLLSFKVTPYIFLLSSLLLHSLDFGVC